MKQASGRFQAFIVHFLISIGLLAPLLAVMCYFWFPGALFKAAGGLQGVKILVPVYLVLGPLITFFIFNNAKPRNELLRDVCVVGVLQGVALIAGMVVIYSVKPMLVVHVFDTVYVLTRGNLESSGISLDELDKFSGNYPKFVSVSLSTNPYDFVLEHTKNMLSGNVPFEYRYDLYENLPRDLSYFTAKLGGDELCLNVDIESGYDSGRACLNIVEKKLTHFER